MWVQVPEYIQYGMRSGTRCAPVSMQSRVPIEMNGMPAQRCTQSSCWQKKDLHGTCMYAFRMKES